MWVSLNEIEATAVQAARGAGYSPGLARQAAGAARWLAMCGLPFLRPLTNGVLKRMHELESLDSARQTGSSFSPNLEGHSLGPISVFTALSDGLLPLPNDDGELSFRHIAAPVLLLPALCALSRRLEQPLLVRWPGAAVECRMGEAAIEPAYRPALNSLGADWLALSRLTGGADGANRLANLRHQGAELDGEPWRTLKALAGRTYICEAETSRQRGMGAGFTDRD